MMTLRKLAALLFTVSMLGMLPGCFHNAEALKKKYFDSANHYFEHGKYREAAIQFSNAIRVDPNYAEAQFGLGVTCQRLGRWQESYRALKKAVELQPSMVLARLELAELLISTNQANEARAQVEAAQALDPKNVRAQSLLARTYLADHDYARAIEEFRKAQQLDPSDALLWISSGFAGLGTKQYQAAEGDFRKALQLDPDSTEAYVNLANLYRLVGRDSEVEPLLRQATGTIPRSIQLYLSLADFYFQQGRVKDAEGLFDQVKSHPGDFPNLRLQLGDFWTWHNDSARAVEEYRSALVEKSDPLVQRKLVNALISAGRLDEAESLNQRLLAQNPKDLEARDFRGALEQLRGNSAGAIVDLQAVLKEEPGSLFAKYYLGLALKSAGRQQEAQAAFVDCLRLDENFGHAFQQLGEIALEQKDWKLAIESAKRAIALLPRTPDGYVLLAQTYLAKGEAPEAERVLTELGKVAPDLLPAQELLAQSYIAQGKIERGIRAYQQVWARQQNPVETVDRFANSLAERGKLDVAIGEVQKLNAGQARAGYYEILAHLYLRKGDFGNTETACRRALGMDGSRWLGHLYLGDVYDRLHRPDEAVREYDEVIKSQPQMIPPYILAGDVRLRQGHLDQAGTYFQAAQKRQSDSTLVQHSLARLWAEQGTNLVEATALVQGLQQRFADDPDLSDTLGWIYFQKGLYSPALTLLKHCTSQKPGSALFQLHLGMTYLKLGQVELGRGALRTAIRLGLNSERWEGEARDALEPLRTEAR